MNWVIHFDEVKRLVFVNASGAIERLPLRQMSEEVRNAVVQHGPKGVLIDYSRAVPRLEPYEIFERPKVLTEIGFPADVKVAVVFSLLDENTQFLENVYQNKHFPVRVFADQTEALSWLQQSGPDLTKGSLN